MATHSGNNGDIQIGANSVASVTSWTLDEGIATMDSTAIGDTSDTHLTGTANWSGTVECFWDETDATGQEAMTNGASVDLSLLPDGVTTGDIDFNGTATIEGISRGSSNNNMVTATFTFKGNGALTRTVLV